MQQRADHLDLHPLAEREVPHRLADEVVDVEQFDQLVAKRRELGTRDPVDRPVQLVRVERRQVPLELVAVAHHERDPAEEVALALRGDVPEHARLAGRRVEEPGEHLQRRRLAGAVRAEKADDLSLADLEDDVVDRADLTMLAADEALDGRAEARLALGDHERLVQLGDSDGGFGHGQNLDDAPVRILLVSQMYPSPAAPDFGVFVQGLERELTARGHVFERVVLDRRGGGKLRHARLAGRAVRAARRFRPDVVYAHFLFPSGFSGLLAARAARAPLVVTAHGQDVAQPDAVPLRPPACAPGREGRRGGDRGAPSGCADGSSPRSPPRRGRRRSSTAASTWSGSRCSTGHPGRAPRSSASAH